MVKLLGLLCVSALAASVFAGDGGDGFMLAFTILPLLRTDEASDDATGEEGARALFERYAADICITIDEVSHIYNRTLVALFRQNTRVLRDMTHRTERLCREAEARRRAGVALHRNGPADLRAWLFGTRATIYLAEVCEALDRIVRPACEHVERGAGALSKEQTVALMRLNDAVDGMTHKVTEALSDNSPSDDSSAEGLARVRRQRKAVLECVDEYTREQILRGGDDEGAATDLLFLTLLGETKTLTLRMSNLLKVKRYSLHACDGDGAWDDNA